MKLKNYILTIACLLFITGCTAEYNIKINKKNINELSAILNFDKNTWDNDEYLYGGEKYKDRIDDLIKLPRPIYKDANVNPYDEYNKIEGIEYYKQTLISNNKEYGIKYEYKIPIEKYKDSSNIATCYQTVNIINSEDSFSIETSNEFNCFKYYEMLDEVVINITTSGDYEVVISNADKVNNGKYTWIINKDNAYNKPIEIELKKVINWKLILFISVPSIIVIIIICFILKRRIAKNNQI